MNTIMIIFPYKIEDIWVFDDEKVGLIQEPFVSGADVILDKLTHHIPNADKGVKLLFSESKFPGFQEELDWVRSEHGGNWYEIKSLNMEGWLCPAMFKYFVDAPKKIFLEIKPK